MNRAEIEEKLRGIILEEKTVDRLAIQYSTPLVDLGIDSLDALNILFAIEETFHVEIPDEIARKLETVGDMIEAIEQQVTA
jgi:acyl carrier protein